MKAMMLEPNGDLSLRETNPPEMFPKGIRVRVKAVGVNRADVLQAAGHYPAPPGVRSDILGLEYAGEVLETDSEAKRWTVGAKVMGIVPGASYAQEVVVHEDECMPVPVGMNWAEAAAIPEAFLTAHDALNQINAKTGQTILIHAIGSGVGNAAAQICKANGVSCIGTTRTEAKLEVAKKYGMSKGIFVEEGEFLSSLREITNGVDGIVDFVGSAYLNQNISALKPLGTMIVVGLLGGRIGELDLGKLLRKRLTVKGTVLRSRGLDEKISLTNNFTQNLLPLFTEKRLIPVVDKVFDIGDVERAHSYLLRNQNVGKLIAKW